MCPAPQKKTGLGSFGLFAPPPHGRLVDTNLKGCEIGSGSWQWRFEGVEVCSTHGVGNVALGKEVAGVAVMLALAKPHAGGRHATQFTVPPLFPQPFTIFQLTGSRCRWNCCSRPLTGPAAVPCCCGCCVLVVAVAAVVVVVVVAVIVVVVAVVAVVVVAVVEHNGDKNENEVHCFSRNDAVERCCGVILEFYVLAHVFRSMLHVCLLY